MSPSDDTEGAAETGGDNAPSTTTGAPSTSTAPAAVEQTRDQKLEVTKRSYNNLCCELNLDGETNDQAWKNYVETWENFTLDGDQLHWLACSLYVACR